MELPSILTLLSFALFLYIVVVIVKKPKPDTDPTRIPGPPKLPVIGNLHLLLSNSLPYQLFRDLAAKHGPLMELQLGGVTALVVSSVDVAKQVLKTHDVNFANRPRVHVATALTYGYTDIAFAPYGEYWRHLRKICTLELLSGRRVRQFRPIREEENGSVAEWIAFNEGSPVNLSEKIGMSSFDITCRASVGRETEEKRGMTAALKAAIDLGSGLCVADLYPSSRLLPLITGLSFKSWRVFRQTDRIFESIINQRKVANAARRGGDEHHCEDLMDVLINCQEHDRTGVRLNNGNIKAVILVCLPQLLHLHT